MSTIVPFDSKILSWITFNLVILLFLLLDLKVVHKNETVPSYKSALFYSLFWFSLALLFGGWILYAQGYNAGILFFTSYLIEKSLSLDNVMVFSVIFTSFKIPLQLQYRVLFWGIIGALVLRAAMIMAGVFFIQKFHVTLYIFGFFLLLMGLKILMIKEDPSFVKEGRLWKYLNKYLPFTNQLHDSHFFIVDNKIKKGTPLLAALIFIEFSDIVFAIDSIPAVFAITTDPFIVYTSNVLAILGLRSLYFLLAGALVQFAHLKKGLALILCFVGCKMLGIISVSPLFSLIIIFSVFIFSIIISSSKKFNL